MNSQNNSQEKSAFKQLRKKFKGPRPLTFRMTFTLGKLLVIGIFNIITILFPV